MKHTHYIALITAAAIAIAGGAALARGEGPREPIEFGTLDLNSDGQITLEEMHAHGAARMARADSNGDGFLTLDEVQAAEAKRSGARAAKMFEHRDANADGKLSPDEMQGSERGDRRFSRADTDGNGAISQAEFDAAGAKMRHGQKPPRPVE
ncbi:EF-hand domain-containing protein [Roseobacter sp.]|uniref:EF-hand domain-containing protein n=1 Tax=Roseobacter sp. TaxID=1907202 RepID=UPI003297E57B